MSDAASACFSSGECVRSSRNFSFEADYVLWFLASSRGTSPLATEGLGQTLVRGVDSIHTGQGPASGARLSFGYWQTIENPWIPGGIRDAGVELNYFFVGNRSVRELDQSSPVIQRPFLDANNRQLSGFVVAAPGLATGGVFASSQAEIWGGEVNFWKNVFFDAPGTQSVVSVMAGFRYLDFIQDLRVNSISVYKSDLTNFPAFQSFAGNTLRVADSFAAHNQFYGGQVGISSRFYPEDCFFIDFGAKLAIGTTHEEIKILGNQVRTLANGATIAYPAGVLALPTNIGRHSAYRFTQVPELDLKVTAPLARWFDVSIGFSTIYWSRLLRPGSQVDRTLDVTQIPNFPQAAGTSPTGLNQPFVPFRQSDLWLLGINIGVEVRW